MTAKEIAALLQGRHRKDDVARVARTCLLACGALHLIRNAVQQNTERKQVIRMINTSIKEIENL